MRKLWCGTLAVCVLMTATARADVEAELKGLVDKAIKVMGGAAKVKKLAAVGFKGKVSVDVNGQTANITFEGSMQGLDQARVDATMEFMGVSRTVLMVVNGDKGWAKDGDTVRDAPKEAMPMVKGLLHALRMAQQVVPLKDKAYTLSALGEVQIDNKPAIGVKAARKGFPDVDVFFDKKTRFLVKCQLLVKEKDAMEVNYEFVFSAPKEMSGVQHFTKITTHRDGKKLMEFELTEVNAEDSLAAELFAKPQ
jgi:hypothetical protein